MKYASSLLLVVVVVLLFSFSLGGQAEARRPRGGRRGAVVAARSEVPLSIVTETKCDKGNGVTTATRSASTGKGGSYNAIQTTISASSFSSSSDLSSLLQSGGSNTSEERVALRVETPTVEFIFNIGPSLSNVGISEMPIQDEQEEEEEEDLLDDAIRQPSSSQDLFTVKRIMIEDGLNFTQLDTTSYALMNVTITSPIFNFTYGGLSDGTSHYTTCSLVRGKNASEATIKAARGGASTSASVSPNLSFASDQQREEFYDGLCSKSKPLGFASASSSSTTTTTNRREVQSSLYLSLVSPSGELSLVRADNLFSVTLPPEWVEEFAAEDFVATPECTQKYCAQGDSSCLSNLEIL
jgi:hypothetical protein